MKQKIEIEIDVPESISGEFGELLSLLTPDERQMVKGVITGMLLASGRVTSAHLIDLEKKYASSVNHIPMNTSR